MDVRILAERLITYDTSTPDGIRSAAGFVKGWLESNDISVRGYDHYGLPVLEAITGDDSGPCIVFHGHIDVVPGYPGQFTPQIDGDRLIGRGAYDMKGGLAAMMCAVKELTQQKKVRVRFLCTPDEETEEVQERSTAVMVKTGISGDFAITGEPTNLHIGVQAKGVLAMRIRVNGRAAHGSTPWRGDNAILKGIDTFRRIETLPFSRESSELFDRPSINLGRIDGGDALNKVPDRCILEIDIRYLPNQDPSLILSEIKQLKDLEVMRTFTRMPAIVSPKNYYVTALREAVKFSTSGEVLSVGRDGASDAVAFLEAGIPAVEFGPIGEGHHGPDEWVSISSLEVYRRALCDFVAQLGEKISQSESEVA